MRILVIILLSVFCCKAATNIASSTSGAAIQAAISLCADGDTAIIPIGSSFITHTIYVTNSISVIGQGALTILKDSITNTSGVADRDAMFHFNTTHQGNYRLSSLTITNGTQVAAYGGSGGIIQMIGSTTNMRIDHVGLYWVWNRGIHVFGSVYGVIDHCNFEYIKNFHPLAFDQQEINGGIYGDGSFNVAVNYGSWEYMYVEDCTIGGITNVGGSLNWFVGNFDGEEGCRAAFRHNTMTNYGGFHGTESTQRYRGGRACEFYNNTLYIGRNSSLFSDHALDSRSGTFLVFSNTFSGAFQYILKLNAYRGFYSFPPWGSVDGTKAWDGADGVVYETGQSTSGYSNIFAGGVNDSSKTWTTNQWVGYILRETNAVLTCTAGTTSNTIFVASATWITNQWEGWEITKVSTDEKTRVFEHSGSRPIVNTPTTISVDSAFFQPVFQSGDTFILSRGCQIISNTGTNLTTFGSQSFGTVIYTNGVGQGYEIRKAPYALDSSGRGQTDPLQPGSYPPRPNHQNLNQVADPCYMWDNDTINGSPALLSNGGWSTIRTNREYIVGAAKPGYIPALYPHRLVNTNVPPPPPPVSPTGTFLYRFETNTVVPR